MALIMNNNKKDHLTYGSIVLLQTLCRQTGEKSLHIHQNEASMRPQKEY